MYLGNKFHIGTKEFEAINWLPTKERFEQRVWYVWYVWCAWYVCMVCAVCMVCMVWYLWYMVCGMYGMCGMCGHLKRFGQEGGIVKDSLMLGQEGGIVFQSQSVNTVTDKFKDFFNSLIKNENKILNI